MPLVPPHPLSSTTALRRVIVLALLAGLWAAVNIPAIVFSQWFPLDMPILFEKGGRQLLESLEWIASPYNGTGRYFPVYWLYYYLQYPLFGTAVWPYLLLQSALFLTAALLTTRLLFQLTGSFAAAATVFACIYLNTPVAENLTTVGKGEPLSFLFVICAVTLAFGQNRARQVSWRSGLAISVLFALAIWTKETALVLLGFAGFGAAVSWIAPRLGWAGKGEPPLRQYAFLLVWLGLGWLISKLPYLIFTRTTSEAAYTSYDITPELVLENLRFYAIQHPDIAFFGLVSTGLLLALRPHQLNRNSAGAMAQGDFIFVASLCAMGWGYCLALLIWRWPMAYYMLLPSIVFKVSAIYGLVLLRHRREVVKSYRAILGFTTLVVIYSALQIYYVTAGQIAYSRVYSAALDRIRSIAPEHPRVVLDSYPFFAEQIDGTRHFVKNELNLGVDIHGVGELTDPTVLQPDLLKLLKITPADIEANTRFLPRKGDYVLSFTGQLMGIWFLRGVSPYYSNGSLLAAQGSYEMKEVADERIRFPAWYPHVWSGLPHLEWASVGYKLYRVEDEKPRFFWKNRFPDGWVGPKASLVLNENYPLPVSVKLSVPPYTLPATVSIFRNNTPLQTIDVVNTNELTIDLGDPPSGHTEVTFVVSKSFVPEELSLSRDKRRLAARIALSPDPTKLAQPRSTGGQ